MLLKTTDKRVIQKLAQPLCRNVSGISVISILEDFARDFPGGFLGTFLPATKSGDKIRWLKTKIGGESVLPRIGPNKRGLFTTHANATVVDAGLSPLKSKKWEGKLQRSHSSASGRHCPGRCFSA